MKEFDFIFNKGKEILQNNEVTWRSPSNIALIKYWGKSESQIPKNPSISFTLDASFTQTTLQFEPITNISVKKDKISFKVLFDGVEKEEFKPKIEVFFQRISEYVPFLKDYSFTILTHNSFPHSSGIASSASGMSALALCLMSMERMLNNNMTDGYFYQKASFLARLGSGSAARSIKGKVVVWGEHATIQNSSNIYGVPYSNVIHSNFKNFHDTILLVDKGQKVVSSTVGHDLMSNHPFAERRFEQAVKNLTKLSEVLQNGDMRSFIEIVESEALALHAMMMTSNPYFILMRPNTLAIINKIWDYRKRTGDHVCFTLDAGANVHVLYPETQKKRIYSFITEELISHCQNNQYICDRVGSGSKEILNRKLSIDNRQSKI